MALRRNNSVKNPLTTDTHRNTDKKQKGLVNKLIPQRWLIFHQSEFCYCMVESVFIRVYP